MSRLPQDRPARLQRLERVEAACQNFEAACKQGTPPDLERVLDEADPGDQALLLEELLLLEWTYRQKQGVRPDRLVYRRRFPDFTQVVESAWQRMLSNSTDAGDEDSVVPRTMMPDARPTVVPSQTPAMLVPLLPGYTILMELGQGGMGVVYQARDERLGRLVALKMIKTDALSPERLQRFRIEGRALAALQHPHIVQVFALEESNQQPILVLEYVAGGCLEDRLGNGPLPPREAARLVAILARAVQAAHAAGIVHRDLKPANVLLSDPVPGNTGTVLEGFPKVTDFGLAQLARVDDAIRTHSGAVLGTPTYMSPEQAAGRTTQVGPASDVWALGVILYRCLAGKLPFKGDSVLDTLERIKSEPVPPIRPATGILPGDLEKICLECLEREIGRRPTAEMLAQRLERFVSGVEPAKASEQPISDDRTLPGIPPVTAPSVASRRTAWAWGVGLVALLLVGVGLGAVVLRLRGGEAHDDPGNSEVGGERVEKEGKPVPVVGPLHVKLAVEHVAYRMVDGMPRGEPKGEMGRESQAAAFADGVRIAVDLSEGGYAYVLAFNPDGTEQLLWPVDADEQPSPDVVPPRRNRVEFPTLKGKLFRLNDEPRGGMQAFAVLASREPLPAYSEWRKARGEVVWKKQQGKGVWVADAKGTYPRRPGLEQRGKVEDWPGMPPLTPLCRKLKTGGVEHVEALAFPVRPREDE